MKSGDLIRFKEAAILSDLDDFPLIGAVGVIISDETEKYDYISDNRLFDILICGRIVSVYDNEIEVVDEA